ncbi:MAG: fasciclin domain-containing protein [Marinicaulis sp.]|nr:fasciclin domain-containing protein [Marinicaulis sp.]
MFMKTIIATCSALAIVGGVAIAGHHEKKADHVAMEKSDIVDTAVAAGSFNTLVTAVQAAGLEETLRSDGPFTVFAPTDEAFAALPEGTVENLLKPENKDQLIAILTYHVLPGKTKSKDLVDKTLTVATVNGAEVAIDATDGVTVGGANVIKADIWTSNGVIHVIDSVILPPAE